MSTRISHTRRRLKNRIMPRLEIERKMGQGKSQKIVTKERLGGDVLDHSKKTLQLPVKKLNSV